MSAGIDGDAANVATLEPVRPRRSAPRRHTRFEYLLVVLGVLLLALSIVQVSLWIYTRSVLTAAAGDAAAASGHGDSSIIDVTADVADSLGSGIASSTKDTLHCTRITTLKRVEVRCMVDAPGVVGLLDGVLPQITAVDHIVRDPNLAALPAP